MNSAFLLLGMAMCVFLTFSHRLRQICSIGQSFPSIKVREQPAHLLCSCSEARPVPRDLGDPASGTEPPNEEEGNWKVNLMAALTEAKRLEEEWFMLLMSRIWCLRMAVIGSQDSRIGL
jgi:hypothetical protein